MGASTVRSIVIDTCKAIWLKLFPAHMPVPTQEHLNASKTAFWNRWNFPNCVGAIDGKHCRVKCPAHSGSLYYNYKNFFPIVLQGLADADYRFICIEVGGRGNQSDGGTFSGSALYQCLENNTFNMPPDEELPNSNVKVPVVLIGDEAYPLKPYLLRPFPRTHLGPAENMFNYRLSRARRCVECAFGLLYAKWRVISKAIETNVETAISIVKCICVLHNVVRERDGENDPTFKEVSQYYFEEEDNGIERINRRNNRATRRSLHIREVFKDYIMSHRLL